MILINENVLKDKIYACWTGKNIGGTMGFPYEGQRELNDIQGYSTPVGTVLPNDDLDLQLIWLKALEDRGAAAINEQLLGEYWLNYITPHWNEYGIGKNNLKLGLLPPLSGEYNNYWKHSNGAWIRSEIWACITPGCPDAAIKLAYADACVDHGMGEGTYAELFTASVQSAAFVIDDALSLIKIGLSKIPADCRIAKSVNMVVDAYKKGTPWKETRELVLQDSLKDLGWFQAPANVAYTMLGLLYGEGDFKKSMILAINCGDDTDCTGATLGALLGIMYGTKAIPEDWRAHINDNIVTIAVDVGSYGGVAKTCTELSERVYNLVAQSLSLNHAEVAITSGEGTKDVKPEWFMNDYIANMIKDVPPYSNAFRSHFALITVDYGCEPVIKINESFKITVSFLNRFQDPRYLQLRLIPPDSFDGELSSSCVLLDHDTLDRAPTFSRVTITITANEYIQPINRGVLEVTTAGKPGAMYIPIILLA